MKPLANLDICINHYKIREKGRGLALNETSEKDKKKLYYFIFQNYKLLLK